MPVTVENHELWVGGRAIGLPAPNDAVGEANLFFRPA